MQDAGASFIQDMAVILLVALVVGRICQRIRLSVIVGYLLAGILVGPFMGSFSLVTNEQQIETVAQVGLVFLMFSIGLKLSLRKMRRLGAGMIVAVFSSAGILYFIARSAGSAAGLDGTQTMFLGGAFMVCSSMIMSKVLQEEGVSHEQPGQLALGFGVLEDVVAVIMLTTLNSLVQFGVASTGEAAGSATGTEGAAATMVAAPPAPEIGTTLGHFGAFVVLAGVAGLLLVPWMLRRMSIKIGGELQTLGTAGLLFALATIAQRAGYSLALGAFLLGMIISETPQKNQVERTFEGMRDVFSSVFFVAIGMQINPALLGGAWVAILGLTVAVLAARTLAPTLGLILIGTAPKDALRTGLALTPIGEFSFIIAQLGVSAKVMPAKFYPTVVGVSLLTTLVAPLLTRRSHAISDRLLAWQPRWLASLVRYYQGWLERFDARSQRSALWQQSRPRLIRIGVGVFFVTGVLMFSEPLLELARHWMGPGWDYVHAPDIIFWTCLSLILVGPLVSLWRNASALAVLCARISLQGQPHAAKLMPVVTAGLKTGVSAALYVWLGALLPGTGSLARWLLVVIGVVALLALFLLRRRLMAWHGVAEVELQTFVDDAKGGDGSSGTAVPWLRTHSEWEMQVGECVLPDLADCRGRTLVELNLRHDHGCSVVSIERQGTLIPMPPPSTALYPLDKVLLMGTQAQIEAGRHFLTQVTGTSHASGFEDLGTEKIPLPAASPAAGRTLRELGLIQTHQVQVVGIHREIRRLLNPGGDEMLMPGDELLVLGTSDKIQAFREWLTPQPPSATG
ncbi:cation:proton antiporter [Geminisphaera colitermitum]|uniref:cation:proton antiporter n=1 Tax=Geminisphaera colitermitum TaxID=1148786 RepID=UPI000158C5C7|nr:cation:proton antiporter [Geminisphaera colitermitum]